MYPKQTIEKIYIIFVKNLLFSTLVVLVLASIFLCKRKRTRGEVKINDFNDRKEIFCQKKGTSSMSNTNWNWKIVILTFESPKCAVSAFISHPPKASLIVSHSMWQIGNYWSIILIYHVKTTTSLVFWRSWQCHPHRSLRRLSHYVSWQNDWHVQCQKRIKN